MKGYIAGYNFAELECMKYWTPPASWTDEKKRTETRNRIFSGDWYGSQKRDGALYVFLKDEDGNITLRGRSKSVSGEYLDKWDHLPHLIKWADSLPKGTCFIGEVYCAGNEGAKNTTAIMNCLTQKAIERQHDPKNTLHYYIFDVLAWSNTSCLDVTAAARFKMLDRINETVQHPDYVEFAHYVCGEQLWETLQQLLADGYEGMVITHKDALYEPGKRPSKTTLKVKQELKQTIDCVVIGGNPPTKIYTGKLIYVWRYWINDMTGERLPQGPHFQEYQQGEPIVPVTKNYYFKWIGSLKLGLLDEDGMMKHYGDLSGLSEEILTNWRDYIGKVVEVGGMMLDAESGVIRHPKLIQIREDKSPYECSIKQILQ